MTSTLEWIFSALEGVFRTASKCLPILEFWFKAATRNQGKLVVVLCGVSSDEQFNYVVNVDVGFNERRETEVLLCSYCM